MSKKHRCRRVFYKNVWPRTEAQPPTIRYGWHCVEEKGQCQAGDYDTGSLNNLSLDAETLALVR